MLFRDLNFPLLKIILLPTSILPSSGVINPKIHFNNTDLPVPDLPIITEELPFSILRFTPLRIFFLSKDL